MLLASGDKTLPDCHIPSPVCTLLPSSYGSGSKVLVMSLGISQYPRHCFYPQVFAWLVFTPHVNAFFFSFRVPFCSVHLHLFHPVPVLYPPCISLHYLFSLHHVTLQYSEFSKNSSRRCEYRTCIDTTTVCPDGYDVTQCIITLPELHRIVVRPTLRTCYSCLCFDNMWK
jgi:hypothetical protein